MSDFYEELDRKKFLFVVFQKQKWSKDILLKKVQFWNFPANDLGITNISQKLRTTLSHTSGLMVEIVEIHRLRLKVLNRLNDLSGLTQNISKRWLKIINLINSQFSI
jgi:hypothetical protein